MFLSHASNAMQKRVEFYRNLVMSQVLEINLIYLKHEYIGRTVLLGLRLFFREFVKLSNFVNNFFAHFVQQGLFSV